MTTTTVTPSPNLLTLALAVTRFHTPARERQFRLLAATYQRRGEAWWQRRYERLAEEVCGG